MTRRISSKWTSVMPFVALALYAPIILFHVVAFDVRSPQWWLLTLLIVFVGIVLFNLDALPRHLDVGEQHFTITDRFGKAAETLPLTAIEEIQPSWFSKNVTIILNTDSRFGRKIIFMPTSRMLTHPIFGHPDVEWLHQAVINAREEHRKSNPVNESVIS